MSAPECFGCGTKSPNGLEICGQYLCPHCEQNLVASKASHSEYQHWIERCRQFWQQLELKSNSSSSKP